MRDFLSPKIQAIKLFLSSSPFVKNVLTMATGNMLAQGALLLVLPILSRLYEPYDFGILSLYLSLSAFLACIATGNYEYALVLPAKVADGRHLLALCFSTTLTMTVLLCLLSLLSFFMPLNILSGYTWIYFLPIGVFFLAFNNTANSWANRNKNYPSMALSKICGAVVNMITSLTLGIREIKYGLILGMIFGQGISVAILWKKILFKESEDFKTIKSKNILDLAQRYSLFPKFNMWQSFFDHIRIMTINFSISFFLDPSKLGLYFFGFNAIQVPLSLLGQSVSTVYYQRLSEIYKTKGTIWAHQRKMIRTLVLAILPIFLILLCWGPQLFNVIFGQEWREAGRYAQILAPYLLTNFVSSAISTIPLVLEKQKQFLFWGIAYSFLMPSTLFLCFYLRIAFPQALGVFSGAGTLFLFFLISWMNKISRGKNEDRR